MNIRIRLMHEGEEAKVNEVYNAAYGNTRPLEYFEWEFLNGPWGKAIYIIAEDLDVKGCKIVGTQSAIPIILINEKGDRILSAKSEDTFVDPGYRGQKLFENMYQLLFEECRKAKINYIWGFTYARKPFLKIGFEIPFDSVQGIRIQRILESYNYLSSLNPKNRLKEYLQIGALCLFGLIKRFFSSLFSSKEISVNKFEKLKPTEISRFDTADRSLWNIERTKEYIDWRYNLNPHKNNFLQYFSENNSSGIVNNRLEGFSYLEEIVFNNRPDIKDCTLFVESVLKENSKICRPFLYRFWGFTTNQINSFEVSILKKCGFVFIPSKGTSFVWKSLDSNSLIFPQNLNISRAYTQGNR